MWRANLRWRATVLARVWYVLKHWCNCGPVTVSTGYPSGVHPQLLSSWLKWRDQFSMIRGVLHWICYQLSQSWLTLRSSQRHNKVVIGSDLHWLATHLIRGLTQWRGMVAQNAHYKHRLHEALIHWLVCSLSRTVWSWHNTVKVSVRQQLILHNATLLWRARQLSEAIRCWIAAAMHRHKKQSQVSVGMGPPFRHHTDRGSSQLGLVESVLVLAGELRVAGECIVQPLRGALSARQWQAQLDTLVGSSIGSSALQGLLGVLCAENALQMCGGRIEGGLLVVDQLSQCITVLRRSGRAIAANSLEDNTAAMLKSLSSMPHSTDSHKTRWTCDIWALSVQLIASEAASLLEEHAGWLNGACVELNCLRAFCLELAFEVNQLLLKHQSEENELPPTSMCAQKQELEDVLGISVPPDQGKPSMQYRMSTRWRAKFFNSL